MLSEFNSNEAIGSAMEEAEKSANNWAGSLNKVKNSWDSLVNEFINSDNAISILQSVNTILQNLRDSAASGALRTLGNSVASLLEIISKLTNKIGTLPTLLAGLGVINSLRGKGVLGGEAFKQANGSLLAYIKNLDVAKVKTMLLQAATRAFAEAALMIAISKATEAINNFIHAEEQGIEAARELRETTLENIRSYNSEASESKELLSSYVELASTTSNLADEKKKLLDIQDKVNESISEQTEKTDLLNKSLSENIKLMQDQRRREAEKVVEEIQGQYDSIRQAQSASYEAMYTFGDKEVGKAVSEIEIATGMRISGTLSEQSAQLEKMLALYRDIDGYNHSYYNTLVSGKQVIDDQLADWETIVKTYDEARKTISELSISEETQRSFDDLINKAGELYRELNGEGSAEHKLIAFQELSNIKAELYDIAGNNSELRNLIETTFEAFDNGSSSAIKSIGDLRSAWLETLDDMQKGSLKNISTMVSALQDLSENKGIAANTFWSLVEFDTEGLLNGAKLVGDKFYITQENMIKLKDQYVNKQIESIASTNAEIAQQKKLYDEQVKSYELQIAEMELRKTNVTSPDEYNNLVKNLEIAKQNAKAYGDEWERNNWLIQYLNQSLGNTIDRTKQLQAQQKKLNEEVTKLNKELDARLKAQEYVIDNIISGHEEELAAINEEKQALQDELDALNEQKSALDELIKNYETVNSLVQNTVQKEIDSLEEQKKAIEDTYKKRIDALKSENEQREDALEYAQKLANLENARNNKRYVYDETRGWRYESVKEDVQNAENDLKSFETSQAIKDLEKQRDEETATIDKVIKSREEYAKLWKEISEEIKTEEDELLAQEILGADWRQKIADGDIDVMNKFRTEYRNHNAALKTLTNTEIKLKEEAIKAKDAEVKAKQEQIDSWKKYKTEVQKAVSEAKSKQEEYMKYLDDVKLSESSTLADRTANFETFKNNVNGMMDAIGEKQNIIEQVTASLDQISGGDYQINFDVWGLDNLREARDILDDMAIKSMEVITSQEMVNRVLGGEMSLTDAVKAMREGKIRGYSSGGVVDSTGIAMLHGRKNAPELILNAKDTAKIYNLIHNTPNLMAAAMDEARNLAGFKLNNSTNNSSVAIGAINVYANNPNELTRNLDKELDQYFRTKLTQSYTGRQ